MALNMGPQAFARPLRQIKFTNRMIFMVLEKKCDILCSLDLSIELLTVFLSE